MRKNKKAILSLALAASLFLSGATSHAAFSAGQKLNIITKTEQFQ